MNCDFFCEFKNGSFKGSKESLYTLFCFRPPLVEPDRTINHLIAEGDQVVGG
jgi:hypothetical protein